MASPGEQLQLPNPDEHIPYVIHSQRPDRELTPDNRFVDIWEISFEGPSGTVGKITVPDRLYTAAYVDQMIEAKLQQMESVAALGPQPHPENLQE